MLKTFLGTVGRFVAEKRSRMLSSHVSKYSCYRILFLMWSKIFSHFVKYFFLCEHILFLMWANTYFPVWTITIFSGEQILIYWCFDTLHTLKHDRQNDKSCCQKKNRIMWGKFPRGGPPPPPPVLETHFIKKKLDLFFILEPQEYFWSSPKKSQF